MKVSSRFIILIVGFFLSFQVLYASEERSVRLKAGYNALGFNGTVSLTSLREQIGFDNLVSIQGGGQGSVYKKEYVDNNLSILNSFEQSSFGKAYWINVTSDVTFTYNLEQYSGTKEIALLSGWNFVGAIATLNLAKIKEQLGAENLLVIQGSGQNKSYQQVYVDEGKAFLNSFTAFEEGEGYWIKVEHPARLSFSFSPTIDSIFSEFNVGFGGSSAYPFASKVDGEKIWVSANKLVLDNTIENNAYYANIKEFNSTAFSKLQDNLKKSKFLIFWLVEGWQESWFDRASIQASMDAGYIPVFNYWYFGDKLIAGMPDASKKEAYRVDNIRVANFLSTLNGKKMLILEPEFNKKPVLASASTQHEFASLISLAIDTIKAKNSELLFSLSMMDRGSRGVSNTESKCGYTNCSLGDMYAWNKPDIVFSDLINKLDFISFHQMLGAFSRDYSNPGDWDNPNPRNFSDEALGIDFLADRISNFTKFLHDKYNKPVFMPYIGIMTATWNDANSNHKIETNEIVTNGWVDKANDVYKKLSILKPTLKANGLFGFAPMALFDNPRHDYAGYQYFMNNEYHLGIMGSSAVDEVDIAPYGDLQFKGEILEHIFNAYLAPTLTETPTSTSLETLSVEVNGEIGSRVFVNNTELGVIGSSGRLAVHLDTSGSNGTKSFTIALFDALDNESLALTFDIEKVYDYLPSVITDKSARDFLSMTTFGATPEMIIALKSKGIERWVDEQLASPYTMNNHLRRMIKIAKKIDPNNYPENVATYIADNDNVFNKGVASFFSPSYQMTAWFQGALFDENQLQHRVSYALSQIVVESLAEEFFTRRGEALAVYFDILNQHALGNYRDILLDISHSASMGLYLTYNGSKKEERVGNTTIYPDENYAREIMQLFSIGLSELNLDGTEKLDALGNTIPTYTQSDVNELAKVFTGWDLKRNSRFGRVAFKDGDVTHPLEFSAEHHDSGAKSILGKSIQAGNDGTADISDAIDILMAHPNIAPFISKQLIMRLTKSNPTPAYIARVATVFNDNGEGVKGDLKAVVKSIFLDRELWEVEGVKKFKEPLLAYTEFLRAFHVDHLPIWRTSKGGIDINNEIYIHNTTAYLGQGASRAFTVFNFYNNNYIANDDGFKQLGLHTPELQIQTDSMMIAFSNKLRQDLLQREKRYLLKKYGTLSDIALLVEKSNLFFYIGKDKFLLDCKEEYDVMEKALEGSANGTFKSFNRVSRENDTSADAEGITNRDRAIKALIVELDNKLLSGTLGEEKKNLLFETYKSKLYSNGIIRATDPTIKIYIELIVPIVVAIVTSENFMVQE